MAWGIEVAVAQLAKSAGEERELTSLPQVTHWKMFGKSGQ